MGDRAVRSLPPVPVGESQPTTAFLSAAKEVIDTITGKRDGQIQLLSADASTAEIIDKLNELINRLQ